MLPILFDFGTIDIFGYAFPLRIYTYGTLMALAFLMAMAMAARQARKQGLNPDRVYDLGLWVLISALAGARLFYILLVAPDYFLKHPMEVFALNKGGLVFYGGLVVAIPVAIWFVKRHKIPMAKMADIAAPSIALGHAIGRLGCLAYGCCYGRVWPWLGGICFPKGSPAYYHHLTEKIPLFDAVPGVEPITITLGDHFSHPVFPTQLVASFTNMLIFSILIILLQHKKYDGQVMYRYLLLYPVFRFLIEFFRGDNRGEFFLHLSHSQWISIVIFLVGVGLIIRHHVTAKPAKDQRRPKAGQR